MTQQIEQLFSADQIAKRIAAIAADIRRDAGETEVVLLAILKGAACFTADLLRNIPGAVTFGFIDVIRDESDTATAAALEIDFLSDTDVSRKNVYVIKDVVSTGIIESYLMAQLRSRTPAALRLVALLDRVGARTIDLKTDYSAFEVQEGAFVGYGLEIDGRNGNLPYIGRVR